MKILALDTSTAYAFIAIVDGKTMVAKESVLNDRSHNEKLLPLIDQMLKRTGLTLSDIDCFAVGIGPGSFTGIRVGLSTVKALAFSQNKKVMGVPSPIEFETVYLGEMKDPTDLIPNYGRLPAAEEKRLKLDENT